MFSKGLFIKAVPRGLGRTAVILFAVLTMVCWAGSICLAESAAALQPYDAYKSLSYYLRDQFPQAAGKHNVHLVLAVDTSGSMNDSTLLHQFQDMWDWMLEYFFVPGDRFTLIPFHNQVLAPPDKRAPDPEFQDRPEKDLELASLRGWFADSRYIQGDKDRGTALFQVQKHVLEKARSIAEQDKERVVVVLVVSDDANSNPINADQKAADEIAKSAIPALMGSFKARETNTQTDRSFAYVPYNISLRGASTRKLVVFHAVESNWQAKPERDVHRKIYLKAKPEPLPPPPPDQSWLSAAGLLALLLAGACLAFVRFHVTVIGPQGSTERVVSAFQPVSIIARNDARQSPSNEVWLPLDDRADPRPLMNISGLWPTGCVVKRVGDGVLRKASGTDVSEMQVPYGVCEPLAVGLQENKTTSVQVIPEPWRKGKTWQLTASVLLVILAFVCWGVYASQPEYVPQVNTQVSRAVDLFE